VESLDLAQAAETVSYSEVLAIYVSLEVLSKEPKQGQQLFLRSPMTKIPEREVLDLRTNTLSCMLTKCSHI
jgi:hypothetical protein